MQSVKSPSMLRNPSPKRSRQEVHALTPVNIVKRNTVVENSPAVAVSYLSTLKYIIVDVITNVQLFFVIKGCCKKKENF